MTPLRSLESCSLKPRNLDAKFEGLIERSTSLCGVLLSETDAHSCQVAVDWTLHVGIAMKDCIATLALNLCTQPQLSKAKITQPGQTEPGA